ncbi:ribonuclease P protein subunit p29-like [Mustela erminea]|uniref:ribonuclease P protein subunit p29-like n=1 Tax=Mustela erminea TaxID=36723 RepID=UPI001386B375|nr:ribonuclease P protein subunit p29-like [Mustela erminea]
MRLPGAQQAETFVRAFLKHNTPHMSQQAREDQLQRKAVVLEYTTRRKHKEKRKKSKGLSAGRGGSCTSLTLSQSSRGTSPMSPRSPEHPQHHSAARLCATGLDTLLSRGRFQITSVEVTKSKCPSYVGVTGILLQETAHFQNPHRRRPPERVQTQVSL